MLVPLFLFFFTFVVADLEGWFLQVALIPVLRAGLGMVEGCVSMLAENTQILHLLLQRDHETLQPKTYYQKLGDHCTATTLYILDPMIGTVCFRAVGLHPCFWSPVHAMG